MKKSVLIIVVLVLSSLALFFFNRFFSKSDEEYLESYLEDNGFTFSEEGQYYQKVNSELTMDEFFKRVSKNRASDYEEIYFYPGTYNIAKVKMNYNDHVTFNYNASNDLVNDVINYKYEVVIYSSSIIVGGTYENGKFSCDIVMNNEINEDSKSIYCSKAEYETVLFREDSQNLTSNSKISNIIDKGHEEVFVTDDK